MARTKTGRGSGRLHRNKLPARILECVCSWDMCAQELALELHENRPNIWRALANMRKIGWIETKRPARWNQIIIPTEAGRQALDEYNRRMGYAKTSTNS